MVPAHLLVHEVVRVRPAQGTDGYGNTSRDYGAAAARKAMRAWLQQDQRTEVLPDGRGITDQRWLMITNDSDVQAVDRIEWAGHPQGAVVFELDGAPEPAYSPGGFHHLEVTLQVVDG